MGGGAWLAVVHGVAKSWTELSEFTFTFHFHALEKEMATHSSVLAWRIPGTGSLVGWSRQAAEDESAFSLTHITSVFHIYQYLRYTDDTTLMAESEEELKSLLMKVKEESEKVGLKLNI